MLKKVRNLSIHCWQKCQVAVSWKTAGIFLGFVLFCFLGIGHQTQWLPVSYKTKHTVIIKHSNPTPKYLPKRNLKRKKKVHKKIGMWMVAEAATVWRLNAGSPTQVPRVALVGGGGSSLGMGPRLGTCRARGLRDLGLFLVPQAPSTWLWCFSLQVLTPSCATLPQNRTNAANWSWTKNSKTLGQNKAFLFVISGILLQ